MLEPVSGSAPEVQQVHREQRVPGRARRLRARAAMSDVQVLEPLEGPGVVPVLVAADDEPGWLGSQHPQDLFHSVDNCIASWTPVDGLELPSALLLRGGHAAASPHF